MHNILTMRPLPIHHGVKTPQEIYPEAAVVHVTKRWRVHKLKCKSMKVPLSLVKVRGLPSI